LDSWNDRVSAAEERGTFTFEDMDLSLYWHTCAVGERLNVRKHGLSGLDLSELIEKHDRVLWSHGAIFGRAVNENNIKKARDVLGWIAAHAPSADLLAALRAEARQ
jgi:hypothetical protein